MKLHSLTDSIAHYFDKQMQVFPQEKIHLHTDRNIYVPGEIIWFKAYVTEFGEIDVSELDERGVFLP